jgi:hypothetical protein
MSTLGKLKSAIDAGAMIVEKGKTRGETGVVYFEEPWKAQSIAEEWKV